MNVLDSNVEALAFNYLSFGVLTALNNLWTWLALLTAALSFWKIRSKPKPDVHAQAQAKPHPHPVPVADSVTVEQTEATRNGVAEDVDGMTKGKFTVYYSEMDMDMDMQCTCEEKERLLTAWEEREGSETEWWRTWERLLRSRNGESENGWYTWQDLTELNGNVVRLWDGGLSGSFGRESLYNSSCIMSGNNNSY